jgi:uncharacterized membrane protein YeaQ/YmgE (transglycosylase-associated protein family)
MPTLRLSSASSAQPSRAFSSGLIGVGFGGWLGYLVAGFIGASILIAAVRAIRR